MLAIAPMLAPPNKADFLLSSAGLAASPPKGEALGYAPPILGLEAARAPAPNKPEPVLGGSPFGVSCFYPKAEVVDPPIG